MAIETFIETLPAHWASALINGDRSGMTEAEATRMDKHLANYEGEFVDVGESYFTWAYSLYGGDAAGGDVADYTVVCRD